MDLTESDLEAGASVHARAVRSLFGLFDSLCEGAVAVDRNARIVWINDKYRALLGLGESETVLGRDVEDVIPQSLMRHVVETGQPILLDIMRFQDRWFVVTRLPLRDESGAVAGAVGFVLFDRLDYLKPLVSKFEKLQARLIATQRELDAQRRARYTFSQFVGHHPLIHEVKRLCRRAAQLDTTVLLLGETGTGKELLAQAIHGSSVRANRSFVAVNASAIPENLMEAEFFGVAPNAFTGADRRGRDGKLKLADGGTLFLDEIGDMPMALQAKLLRVLQEQEFERVGSNEIIRVDVRVIAATGRNLKEQVDQGRFRADLYFRVNVLPISVPPLRERLSDIVALADVILEQLSARTGMPLREIDESAMGALMRYGWPGNVRELRNVLERACMISDRRMITAADIVPLLTSAGERAFEAPTSGVRPLAEMVRDVERTAIQAALVAAGGKKTVAAKLLGISRAKLYEKLAAYKLSSDNPT